MAENSKIEWTAHTFNPWRGCTKVSPECAHCYADTLSKRNPATLGVWGPQGTRVVAAESYWRAPLKWNRDAAAAEERRRVFCASLADVFEEWRGECLDHEGNAHYTSDRDPKVMVRSPDLRGMDTDGLHYTTLGDVRRRLFALIDVTPNLDWLLLTKRPENIQRMWPENRHTHTARDNQRHTFRPNVWLGTSAGTQETADKAIPELLRCRDLSPVLFVSAEPLLGPLTLRTIGAYCTHGGRFGQNVLTQEYQHIDWVIVGGESGPKARPMELEWVESIADQCDAAGVPLFVKQDSGQRSGMRGRLSDALWGRKEFPTTTEVTT